MKTRIMVYRGWDWNAFPKEWLVGLTSVRVMVRNHGNGIIQASILSLS